MRTSILPPVVVTVLLAVVATAVPGLLLAPPAAAAPGVPAGFRLTTTATGQAPFTLTDVTYLPDGAALTAGRGGVPPLRSCVVPW